MNTTRTPLKAGAIIFFAGIALLLTAAPSTEAQTFRNMAGFSVENYFDNTFGTRLENVFIAPIRPDKLQVQVKVSNETDNKFGDSRSLSMLHTGPIVLFTPNVYGLAVYGAGFRENGALVHELDVQAHYENATFRVGGGARGHIEPADDVAYVVPSIGGRVQLPRGFGWQATYFLGINNDGELSNSIWSEVDYAVTPVITTKLGGSVKLGEDVAWPDDNELTYNIITGIGLAFSESVSARYQFDYIRRASQADGVRNFVFVDWRF
ncbi:MAG: hypothetical protein PF508_17330 [Spirochaeta sp.]|jgi:hypothetical protein|nr:hypothetical protein [Spirochaeta sp.]